MSIPKRGINLKVAGVCGATSPIVALSLISLAIIYSPWFSWTENALSDLGVHEAAILFNSSLMISGILTLIFAIGLMRVLRQSKLGLIGTFVLILAAVSLFAIGFYPETAGPIHFYVSVAFFTLLPISMFLVGVAMISESSRRNMGIFSVLTVMIGIVTVTATTVLPLRGAAIPEILGASFASVWSIILGIRLFMKASKF